MTRTLTCTAVPQLSKRTFAATLKASDLSSPGTLERLRRLHYVDSVTDRRSLEGTGIDMELLPGDDSDTVFIEACSAVAMLTTAVFAHRALQGMIPDDLKLDTTAIRS